MTSADTSGVAMASCRSWALDNMKGDGRGSENPGGEGPEDHGPEQEPVNVSVQAAGVEGTDATADEPDERRRAAEDRALKQKLFDDVQQHRKTLLHLGHVIVVHLV